MQVRRKLCVSLGYLFKSSTGLTAAAFTWISTSEAGICGFGMPFKAAVIFSEQLLCGTALMKSLFRQIICFYGISLAFFLHRR